MQTREKLLGADFYPEEGCPVRPTDIKVVLDVDPFGAPADCKIYITYTNNSSKPISAVKFRCRFADNLGKDRGTFHAVDTYSTSPGGSRSQRWKREGALSPSISAFQMRALQVLFSDGSVWQSQKMEELATPEGTPQWQQGSEPAGITQQMSQQQAPMQQMEQPQQQAPAMPSGGGDMSQRGQQSLWTQPDLPVPQTPTPQQPVVQGLHLDQSPNAIQPQPQGNYSQQQAQSQSDLLRQIPSGTPTQAPSLERASMQAPPAQAQSAAPTQAPAQTQSPAQTQPQLTEQQRKAKEMALPW